MNGGEVHPRSTEWWQASDGLWYPPESHPSRTLPPPPERKRRGEPAVIPRGCNTGIEVGCGVVLVLAVVFLLLVVLLL